MYLTNLQPPEDCMGYALKKIAHVVRGDAIKKREYEVKRDVDDYLELHETQWSDKISTHALNTLSFCKHNKPEHNKPVPLTGDLMKLRKFQIYKLEESYWRLSAMTTPENWRELAEFCLSRMIVFNKRRGGEASQMKVAAFNARLAWNRANNAEIYKSLSESEKELCKRFDMVEILGKRNRKVPVILTPDVKKGILLLNEKRKEVKVAQDNPYIFAVNNGSSKNCLRGNQVLSKVCQMAKVEKPELITSTKLRKYVATVSQLVDMNTTELGWLAKHLGHNLDVHKDFYRLQEHTLEIAVVGNLLMAIDNGEANKFAGKPLREISLNGPRAKTNATTHPQTTISKDLELVMIFFNGDTTAKY